MKTINTSSKAYIHDTHLTQYLMYWDRIKRYSAEILTYLKHSSLLWLPDVIRNYIKEETLFTEQEYEIIKKPSWEFDNQESLNQSYISISTWILKGSAKLNWYQRRLH